MLSREDNERVTRVGPATPMGNLLRRYWMPVCLADELAEADCAPIRVRLLGEDLVAFRDSDGRVGVLEERCPHRRASLFLGRNEGSGLRCVFHGWKFDVSGRCVDMPNEPLDTRFEEKVPPIGYPSAERGSVIWTYLGPAEKQPELPDMEWLRMPETHRFCSKTLEEANYLQALEGGIDSVHSSFLHNNNLANKDLYRQIGSSASLEVERTDYGFRYASIRDVGEDGDYVRVYQFVMPFTQMRSTRIDARRGGGVAALPQVRGHMWVPIDDENTMIYNYVYSLDEDKPLTPEWIENHERILGRGPGGENVERTRTRANDWLIDREMQRTQNFSGIPGTNTQDLAVQESMGPIVDRSREHLGSTDRAIITARRLLFEAIGDVEEGVNPQGSDPATYRRVRPVDMVVPHGTPWREVAEPLLVAAR